MAEPTTSSTHQSGGGAAAGSGNGSRTNGGLVNRMRDSATSQLTAQKERATDGLGSVAEAVRSSTRQLREQHHETAAGYVDQIADHIERLSQGLRQKNVTDLLDDAQRLARRQPAVFIASAFAVGLVAARFLKSSPPGENGGRGQQVSHRPGSGAHNVMPGSGIGMSERVASGGGFAPRSAGETATGSNDESSATTRIGGGPGGPPTTQTAAGAGARSTTRPRRGGETERP